MKISFLLLLTCVQVLAQNSFQTFESNNFIGLKDANGSVLIQPVFVNLGWSNHSQEIYNETIGGKIGEKWGLLTVNGKDLTPPIYDKLEPFFGNTYKVAIKGKFTNRYFYGLIDDNGKIRLNLDYFELHSINDIVIATKLTGAQFLVGALDSDLNRLTPIIYAKIRIEEKLIIAETSNGQFDIYNFDGQKLASEVDAIEEKRSHLITNQSGKIGKISWDGKEVIPAEYKSITLDDQLVTFSSWLIDPNGDNFHVEGDSVSRWNLTWLTYQNDFFQIFSGGQTISQAYKHVAKGKQNIIARTNGNSQWLAFDITGKPVLESTDSIKSVGNFLITKQKKQWTIYDHHGQRITNKSFEVVVSKNSRYLAVRKHNYWAILDGVKKELSPFRYDEIGEINGSKAIVKYINHWGVFHSEKGWILQPNFDKITFWNGYFVARRKEAYYLYDDSGFLRFQTIDELLPSDEMLLVFHEGKLNVIGSKGRPLGNTEYKSITKWAEFFKLQSDWIELYHADGQSILSAKDSVQDIVGYSEGLFLIRKNNHYGFVDEDGKLRIANRYDSARVFSDGLAPIQLRGKWGYLDEAEKLAIQPYYQEVRDFQNGIAIYRLNDLYGFLNRSGQEISKAVYRSIERTQFGNYLIKDPDNRFGFANENGILRLTPSFEEIQDLGNNRIRATRNRKVGLLDYSGREILGFEYDDIQIIDNRLVLRKD